MKNKALISFIIMLLLLCNIKVYATEGEELPSKYDLRNDIDIKVENQGHLSWCGYFCYTKMIETYLQRTKGITYNLSEAYLAHWYSFQGVYGTFALESDFPNKEYAITESNKKKFDNATSKAIGQFKETKEVVKNENDIKEYIRNYGAVWTEVYVGDKKAQDEWHNTNGSINCENNYNKDDPDLYSHSVVIIGWDDNYSRNNFKANNRPEKDGAWLILNSWGTDWGNNGTAWVSYEDYYIRKGTKSGIENLTLSTGEVIETELEEKEEIKEIETVSNLENIRKEVEQQVLEQNRRKDMMTIAYIVIFILLIILIVIKISRNKSKSTKGE